MWSTRENPAAALGVLAAMIVLWLAMTTPRAGVAAGPGKAPEPAAADSSAPLVARNTRGILQDAFQNEVNAKQRYLKSSQIAAQEGYAYVAGLFRACARAEQVHANQHVHAIAWVGDEAKAFLEKALYGNTAENLRVAIDLENYEATQLYPAFLAQARADHMTEAVRSMNFALAAEREHERLFTVALATLDQRPAPRAFHVCSRCGKTVESLDFKICPNCFSPARRFIRVD